MAGASGFENKLEAYVAAWIELLEAEPEVLAFLAESARVLWPRASASVRRKTMIGLARKLVEEAPRVSRGGIDADVAAGMANKVARDLHDRNALAHFHEIGAGALSARIVDGGDAQDEADRLIRRHEEALHLGMGDLERAARLDLRGEARQH